MMQRLAFGLICLVWGAGCTETVDSTDVRTGGVYARYRAIGLGNGTQVTARLLVGGDESNTYLELLGEDELTATVADERKRLQDSNDNRMYVGTFEEDAADTEVTISFNRGPDDVDAPDSTATLPTGFALTGVSTDEVVSRADAIVINWEPSGETDEMEWELDGDCIDLEFDNSQPDTGTLTIPAGEIEPAFEDDAMETCEVTFTMDRIREGTVDRHFNTNDSDGPGDFLAIQRRSVTFRSAP